jgi:Domain of unknown function (DUF1707)/Domain of unknown function (DUF4190)
VTDNQSQWPAQDPRYGPPDGTPQPPEGAQGPATGAQAPTAGSPVQPANYPAPPAGYPVTAAGYPVPPAGYPPAPGSYPPPQAGYPVPPASYQPSYQHGAHASMRASSADRERTVDVLKAGFTEGRLTQDEYNDRMGRAYASRTYGELMALVADLPAGPLPGWPVPAYDAPPATSGTNSIAIASMVLGVAEFFTAGLTAIPAVICGHVARRQMKLTGQRGDGLATSGMVLGYMALIFWAVLIAASLVSVAITVAHNGQAGTTGP